jgi:pyruvate dehydrogenase E1 component alpha subunit
MAELFGRRDGVSKGRGGSMHLFDAKRRFLGGYGIVAGQMPLAIGTGFSSQYRGVDEITVLLSGEGALANGAAHEALNMIGVLKLPVISIVVNNFYGMGTTVEESAANPVIWKRGELYGMHGVQVDGMDVMQVKRTMEDSMQRASAGQPVFIEAVTYRYRGHSIADAARYREKEEVQLWREQDPIERFYRQLSQAELISEEERKGVEEKVNAVVAEAVEFADNSPEPDPSGLFDNLYIDPPATIDEPRD